MPPEAEVFSWILVIVSMSWQSVSASCCSGTSYSGRLFANYDACREGFGHERSWSALLERAPGV